MYEPSKSAGFVDIQDGDAISESSDTEIVAHTEEQVRYDNNASSGDDDSDNDDNDINHGPPPLDSDDDEDSDDDDDDDVQGPPTDNGDKVLTAPAVGGSAALSSRRTVVSSEKRDSPGSDSESDSDGDGKEAPPPLDSEEEGGGDEEAVEEIEPVVEKNGFVSVANESSVHNLAFEHINMQYENDDDETRNLDSDYEDHGGSDHDSVSDGSNHDEAAKESQEEVENVQASLHSLHVRNSDESEHSDSAGEVKGEMEAEKQEIGTDEGDDYDSDQRVELDSAGNAPGETIIAAGESSDILSDNDSQDDEPKDAEETKIHEDAIEEEQRERQSALLTTVKNDHDEMSSEKECNASFQFVPDDDDDDDENELEWDVEDFDLPKRKNTEKTRPASKIDPEGAEVEKLKKSFMDTLRSEAEQAEVVEATQKTGSNKKKKLNKVINSNSRNTDQGQEKREVETKPVKPVHEVRRVPGTARRTKETSPNVGHAKDEKKTIKGETNIAAVKVSDSATKALRTKSKAVDSTVGQRDVHKVSKQRKGVMETQKTSKVSERMPEGKPSKVKSSSVSSLSTGDSELKASQKGKESKKAKPVCDVETDLVSQRTEIVQKQKGERKARKSDSDNSLDSSSSSRKKSHKAATSGSDSKPRKSNAANSQTHKRVENTVEREERKQLDSKQASVKSVYAESYHEDGYRLGNADNNVKPTRNKPKSRPKSNGHSSSSYETLSVHAKRHDHGTRNHEVHHRHSDHIHERGKHVWLCRDDEIHKLIAQKASLLKEYESGSFAGRRLCKYSNCCSRCSCVWSMNLLVF